MSLLSSLLKPPKGVTYSSLRWNAATGRYYLPAGSVGAGRFLTADQVRDIIDADIIEQQRRMGKAASALKVQAAKLERGEILPSTYKRNVKAFADEMASAVRAVHMLMASIPYGGFAGMPVEAYQRVGKVLEFHLDRLSKLRAKCTDTAFVLSGKHGGQNFEGRVALYFETALFTFEEEKLFAAREWGHNAYWNVPRKCACADCVRETKRGKIPLKYHGTAKGLVLIGHRQICKIKCKCRYGTGYLKRFDK